MLQQLQNGGDDGPFIAARREWNEHDRDIIARANNWRRAAFAALLISLVQSVGMVWLVAHAKVVPYVVEIDKLGNAAAVRRADEAAPADIRVIKATIAAWISDARTITSDDRAERAALERLYAFSADASTAFLDDYFRHHLPLGQTRTVSVSVDAVLPVSDHTYEVQWDESERDSQGRSLPTTHWLARLTLAFAPPTDERGILANPLGLYVTNVTWTQRL